MDTTTLNEQQVDDRPAEHAAHRTDKPNKAFTIVGALLMVIAIVAAVGLGVWSYQLNTKLTTTQAQLTTTQSQLASLQAQHDQLKTDHANLATERTRLNATIEQGKADLAKVNADLNTANDQITAQRAKLDLAKTLMSISEAAVNGEGIPVIDDMVRRTKDTQLITLWNAVVRSPTEENAVAFYQYLSDALANALE